MRRKSRFIIAAFTAVLLLQVCFTGSLAAGTAIADYSVGSYSELVSVIARQYVARDPDFTVKYTASFDEVKYRIRQDGPLWDDVFSADIPGTTSDLDYLHENMSAMRVGWTYSGTSAFCEFTQTYRTSAAQEKYVNLSVGSILSSLNIDDDTEYGKIKAIHDYIANNVDYDKTYSRFTAYDALYAHSAVCQGYTLLLYKMLMEAGIPVRIVGGTAAAGGASGAHAWNIVKVGQYWYNVDVTWDDSTSSANYLLKSNASFSDHFRDSAYNTAAFNLAYPMSPDDFDLTRAVKLVRSISLPSGGGAVYAVGDSFLLSPVVAPDSASGAPLSWSTSDPKVAAVSGAGYVTVTGPGTAVITVSVNDGTGKSAAYTVNALLPVTPDAWALSGVNALNARGVVPDQLATRYRESITRAEFTALMTNVFEYAKGPYTLKKAAPFTDIAGSRYQLQISKGYELGIVSGTSPWTFTPDGILTREQCAKIIGAAAAAITGTSAASSASLPFGDAALIDSWALPYVRYAFEKGLMTGTGADFDPLGALTREQAMVICERMIEKYGW